MPKLDIPRIDVNPRLDTESGKKSKEALAKYNDSLGKLENAVNNNLDPKVQEAARTRALILANELRKLGDPEIDAQLTKNHPDLDNFIAGLEIKVKAVANKPKGEMTTDDVSDFLLKVAETPDARGQVRKQVSQKLIATILNAENELGTKGYMVNKGPNGLTISTPAGTEVIFSYPVDAKLRTEEEGGISTTDGIRYNFGDMPTVTYEGKPHELAGISGDGKTAFLIGPPSRSGKIISKDIEFSKLLEANPGMDLKVDGRPIVNVFADTTLHTLFPQSDGTKLDGLVVDNGPTISVLRTNNEIDKATIKGVSPDFRILHVEYSDGGTRSLLMSNANKWNPNNVPINIQTKPLPARRQPRNRPSPGASGA